MSHVLLTGPITGVVTKGDGTVVNVTPGVIAVADQAEANELAHLIGLRYQAEGHPDDIEVDDNPDSDTYGQVVQREFVYEVPAELAETPKKGK
ncbi:MAG: hypothetical protein ACRCYU_19115 [Nocardioides sp.]